MKKVLKSFSFLAIAAIFILSGCVKDTGFENNKYGIKDPAGSPAAVGFNKGLLAKVGIGVNSTTATQTLELIINYTGDEVPTSDITVNLTRDTTAVSKYNTANGTNIQVAPSSIITIPATVVIPAGQRFVSLKIPVNNTASLSPLLEYGIGVRISSASGNVAVAKNLSVVLLTITIKNKYDGRYDLTFTNFHPTLNPTGQGATVKVEMVTTGANSVKLFWYTSPFGPEYLLPAVLSGSLSAFGGQEPEYTFDPATEKLTVQNVAAGAATFYTMDPAYNSRYEPATKKIFAKFGYSSFTRLWIQEFTYTGPRP